jgi:hypothetical protein
MDVENKREQCRARAGAIDVKATTNALIIVKIS